MHLETQVGNLLCRADNVEKMMKASYKKSGHIGEFLDFKIDSLHNKNIINKVSVE